jgi:hypothetical protein
MVETGEDESYADRIAAGAEREKEAWAATLSDMEATAEELRANGWTVTAVAAGDTAPEHPDAGADRFGLVYVIPDNYADEFRTAFEAGQFPTYEVYRARADGNVYLLTQLLDPETSNAILLAGMYELRHALGCVKASNAAGETYTHVQLLDGTHLGSFRHDEPEKFFPPVSQVQSFVPNAGTNENADAGSATGE